MTKKQLMDKLKVLDLKDKDTRNNVVCSLIGHSKIITYCFGYLNCSRCEAQIGDCLGRASTAKGLVIVGHNCDECQKAFKTLTWQDKLYCPDPFKVGK